MMMNRFRQAFFLAGLFLSAALVAGCKHCPTIDPMFCGEGTRERQIDGKRTCVIAPLSCGRGAQEQATGGQRECVPVSPASVVRSSSGTHLQAQATGGQRECVLESPQPQCGPNEIEIIDNNGDLTCRIATLNCRQGMHEQATGGQRECVPNPGVCGADTREQEQATGGQRECVNN